MVTSDMVSGVVPSGALPARQVYTVKEFCEAYAISRGTLFTLWREGRGPKFMKLGGGGFGPNGRLLIPVEEAESWQRRLVAETHASDWRRKVIEAEVRDAEARIAHQRSETQ